MIYPLNKTVKIEHEEHFSYLNNGQSEKLGIIQDILEKYPYIQIKVFNY